MKKWTAVTTTNEDLRWQALSAAMNEKGVANEFVPWTGDAEKFSDIRTLEEFDHVRLSSRAAPAVLKQVKVQSTWTTLLGAVDGMNKTPHGWWPLCSLHESLCAMLIEMGKDLDARDSVLIAGAGASARIVVAAFFKAGFKDFLITNFDEPEAQEMIKELRSRLFGMNVQWVPMERIVLLPGNSSVIVNCTPSVEENALLTELSYLNFLKRPGILFDLAKGPKPSVLAEEVRDAGIRTITGVEISARVDVLWAKWAFQADLVLKEYEHRLRSVLTGA